MNGPRGEVEIDWQELLDNAMCDLQEARRDPQQSVLDVQRLQAMREAVAAIEAAEFQIKNGRCV